MRLKNSILKIVKDLSFRTGVYRGTLFKVYHFMYEPHQLEFLLRCLRQTADVPGACVEVGCAYGATTIFIKKYLDHLGAHKRYIAIDTFSGFVKEHAQYEVQTRGKDSRLIDTFTLNRREWVSHSLSQAGVSEVELVQCDASTYDFRSSDGISFCLIDVDLYKPIAAVLPKVYSELTKGGIIVVDDCQPHPMWDGALVAYEEFVRERGLSHEIVCEKLGVVRN